MAIFTFTHNGQQRSINLLGISPDDVEGAITRLRMALGAGFNPVNLRGLLATENLSALGLPAHENHLKISSSGQVHNNLGNVVTGQDYLSGAVTHLNQNVSGTGPMTASPTPMGLEMQSPRGAFQGFLGNMGGTGVTPLLANFAQGQFNPATAAFAAAQQSGLTPGVDETAQFADFLTRAGGFSNQALANRAIGDISDAVRSRIGVGGQGIPVADSTIDNPNAGQRLAQLLNPSTSKQSDVLFNLARMANTISPLVTDLRDTLASNQPDAVFGEFAQQRAAGNTQNFAQYLAGRGFGGADFGSRLGFG